MRLDLEATVSDDAPMRASDAEREQAADALRDHYAAGRLTSEEFDERLDAAYKSSTVQELAQLRADLPELPTPRAARRAEVSHRQAELRRQLLQQAGGSFTPFAICTLIWAASGADGSFWPVWVLIFPLVFVLRNIWRLHGPAPELDRVQRELEHRRRHGRHSRHPRHLP
jgi:uncharacterized protein YecT (DUF1311 family)